MLNSTLGWLYTLEKEEVAAINADFFRRLDNINEVLTTISGISDTISGTLGVVNTFLSTTQNANLGAMINAQQRTNAILTELVDTFPAKILETVAKQFSNLTLLRQSAVILVVYFVVMIL